MWVGRHSIITSGCEINSPINGMLVLMGWALTLLQMDRCSNADTHWVGRKACPGLQAPAEGPAGIRAENPHAGQQRGWERAEQGQRGGCNGVWGG